MGGRPERGRGKEGGLEGRRTVGGRAKGEEWENGIEGGGEEMED